MKKLFEIFSIITIVITFLFNGCSSTTVTQQNEVEILPADRLVKKLEANRRKIRKFEGTGTISINSPQFNNSANFQVILQKPDSVYLVVFGPFGIELANILIAKKEFIFYDALSNTAYRGEANTSVLKEIFKIDIALNDLVDAFVGSVNLTDKLYRNPTSYKVEYDKYILTYKDSLTQNISSFTVNIRDLGIRSYTETNSKNNIVISGEYSEFSDVENVSTPYRIEIKNPTQKQSILIEYKKIIANSKNTYIDFQLPGDATIIQW